MKGGGSKVLQLSGEGHIIGSSEGGHLSSRQGPHKDRGYIARRCEDREYPLSLLYPPRYSCTVLEWSANQWSRVE